MKKLFVLGDSISMHYGPFLAEYMKDVFEYDRKGKNQECKDLNIASQVNGGDSSNCLEYLQLLPNLEYDVLLLNCGLHDIKTHETGIQITAEEYEKNLKEIVELVRSRGKKIVWVASTPLDDETHNRECTIFFRYNKDIVAYNAVADRVMKELGVPVIDLYSFTMSLDEPLYEDHVHFFEPVRKLHGAFIAGQVLALEQQGLI